MNQPQAAEATTPNKPAQAGSKAGAKEAAAGKTAAEGTHIDFIKDVTLEVAVELGRTDLSIEKLIRLRKGSVIEMEKLSEEPLDVRVNGKLVARGEAVIVNEMFGIRVTQVVAPDGEEVF